MREKIQPNISRDLQSRRLVQKTGSNQQLFHGIPIGVVVEGLPLPELCLFTKPKKKKGCFKTRASGCWVHSSGLRGVGYTL